MYLYRQAFVLISTMRGCRWISSCIIGHCCGLYYRLEDQFIGLLSMIFWRKIYLSFFDNFIDIIFMCTIIVSVNLAIFCKDILCNFLFFYLKKILVRIILSLQSNILWHVILLGVGYEWWGWCWVRIVMGVWRAFFLLVCPYIKNIWYFSCTWASWDD